MLRLGAIVLAAVALAGCAFTVTPDGRTSDSSEAAPYVPLLVDIAGTSCWSMGVDVGVRTGQGTYRKSTSVLIKAFGSGYDSPSVHKFEPGEYHIVSISCVWPYNKIEIRNLLFNNDDKINYKQSYASFVVTPGKMLNIGFLRIHIGNRDGTPQGNVVTRMEIAGLPPETQAALRESYPAEYAAMEKRFMKPAPDAVGAHVDAETTDIHVEIRR